MKFFEKETEAKHWVLGRRSYRNGNAIVRAVDGVSGYTITGLILFKSNGRVIRCSRAKKALEEHGYDPYEHNNKWDNDGRIIVE